MFLAVGTKYEKRRCGHTLSLCPICHCVRVFAVFDLRCLPHIYQLPLTEGKQLIGFVLCEDCGVRLPVSGQSMETVHQSADKTTLWALFLPAARARLLERAEAELELLRRPHGDSNARHAALCRAFVAVDYELTSRLRGGLMHNAVTGMLAGALVSLVLGFGLVAFVLLREPSLLTVLVALLAGGLVTVGVMLAHQSLPRRHIRRQLLPRLVRGVAPLTPTISELNEVEAELMQRNLCIARRGFARRVTFELGQFDLRHTIV